MDKIYDVIIVGGGHAGCEAALATARMGYTTLLLTMNIDTIAQMSCNPAVGGVAKGQIVREIDALGGEMAKVTDKTGIQFHLLNLSKGPAVQSPRAQCDRLFYRQTMKHVLEQEKNLDIRQAEVTEILTDDNKVCGVETKTQAIYNSKAVILTTGTFLKGLIHIGLKNFPAGRMGEFPAEHLSDSLRELGFELSRLNTDTTPRLNGTTVDFTELEPQYGDNPPVPFSHFTQELTQKQLPCYLTYTNDRTHKIIQDNLHHSLFYKGKIDSISPRYCPSIEDKVVKFTDKNRHQVFLEPEGYNTEEVYCNGLFTGLPEDVQDEVVHSIKGCENAQIVRYGYAIEYDFCQPTQLKPTLETKLVDGLYFAGQINGTTGYEEAAGQGLMAGINAVLKLRKQEPFVLGRGQAYIGVLIDDLVTKGIMDPYRMFTSRAEFRLLLRSDNADMRLMDYGYKFGLIPEDMHKRFCKYREYVKKEIEYSEKNGTAQFIRQGLKYDEAIKKIDSDKQSSLPAIKDDEILPWNREKIKNEVQIEIKYEGYIKQQLQEVEKFKKLENKRIPPKFNYDNIPGLLKEARIKLKDIQPQTIGQAARISGVTPADISILSIYLHRMFARK